MKSRNGQLPCRVGRIVGSTTCVVFVQAQQLAGDRERQVRCAVADEELFEQETGQQDIAPHGGDLIGNVGRELRDAASTQRHGQGREPGFRFHLDGVGPDCYRGPSRRREGRVAGVMDAGVAIALDRKVRHDLLPLLTVVQTLAGNQCMDFMAATCGVMSRMCPTLGGTPRTRGERIRCTLLSSARRCGRIEAALGRHLQFDNRLRLPRVHCLQASDMPITIQREQSQNQMTVGF